MWQREAQALSWVAIGTTGTQVRVPVFQEPVAGASSKEPKNVHWAYASSLGPRPEAGGLGTAMAELAETSAEGGYTGPWGCTAESSGWEHYTAGWSAASMLVYSQSTVAGSPWQVLDGSEQAVHSAVAGRSGCACNRTIVPCACWIDSDSWSGEPGASTEPEAVA